MNSCRLWRWIKTVKLIAIKSKHCWMKWCWIASSHWEELYSWVKIFCAFVTTRNAFYNFHHTPSLQDTVAWIMGIIGNLIDCVTHQMRQCDWRLERRYIVNVSVHGLKEHLIFKVTFFLRQMTSLWPFMCKDVIEDMFDSFAGIWNKNSGYLYDCVIIVYRII